MAETVYNTLQKISTKLISLHEQFMKVGEPFMNIITYV